MKPGTQLSLLDATEATTTGDAAPKKVAKASVDKKPIVQVTNNLKCAPVEAPLKAQELVAPLPSKAPNSHPSATPPLRAPRAYDTPPTPEECYLSVREVAKRYSVSVPTIWRWAKDCSQFPNAIPLNSGTTRWRLSDLLAYETRSLEV